MARRLIDTIQENTMPLALVLAAAMLLLALVDRVGLQAEVKLCRSLAPAVSEMIDRRADIITLLDSLQADLRVIVASPANGQAQQLAELVGEIRGAI